MEGWICVHRKICEHWLWQDKPFSRGQAFMDLLLSANHTDKQTVIGNDMVTVKRGSLITSQMKLSERWGWSKTKITNFLKLLERDKIIATKTDRKKTTVNIVNYDKYQVSETIRRPQKDHKKTAKKPQESHGLDTNNKYNNENNGNNENNIPPLPPNEQVEQSPGKRRYAEFVTMTNDEYQSLIDRFGKSDTDRLIEILDNYKGSKGKRYKSDYRAILSWCVKRLEEEKQRNTAGIPSGTYHTTATESKFHNPFLELVKKYEEEEQNDEIRNGENYGSA